MRGTLIYVCLIGPLILALSCSGNELCRYYEGYRGLTKECRDSFCCGTSTFGFCCRDCKSRYPPVTHCENDMPQLSSMQITWLVVGFILLLKGIIAVIYLCCCRNPNRRSSTRTNNVVDTECGTSPSHIPYDPSAPGAPPSYEDLVKDGVLNHAYAQDTCGAQGAPSSSEVGAPPVVPASGLPAPPPYSAVVPPAAQEPPAAAAAATPDNAPEVPR